MNTPMKYWIIQFGRRDITHELEFFESPRAGDWEIYHRGEHLGSLMGGNPVLFEHVDQSYQAIHKKP